MPRLAKELFGQPAGEYLPRIIPAGEECPANLIPAAIELGCLEEEDAGSKAGPEEKAKPKPANKAKGAAPENKAG